MANLDVLVKLVITLLIELAKLVHLTLILMELPASATLVFHFSDQFVSHHHPVQRTLNGIEANAFA